jgi:hypothetical protein
VQISVDGGVQWYNAGISSNQTYITLINPTTTNLFHTVVDIACRHGGTNQVEVLAGIWGDFVDPIPGVMSYDGTEMKYWPDSYSTPEYLHTSELVKEKKGRCGAWARLFRDALAVHGIPSTVYTVNSALKVPGAPPEYTIEVVSGFFIDTSYAGQGNPGPPRAQTETETNGLPYMFPNHAVVKVDMNPSLIFDPSYGLVPISEQIWEDTSVTHFYTIYKNSAGDQYPVQVFNPTGKQISFSPSPPE